MECLFSVGRQQRLVYICTFLIFLFTLSQAFSIRELVKGNKRTDKGAAACPPWQPFSCPSGDCIPFKYICDGSSDCSDGFDENIQLCTAASRPPVEETSSFLTALLTAHGPNYFVPLFGHRAKNNLAEIGGVDKVAVALSQSPTIETFASEMKLTSEEVEQMAKILEAVVIGMPSNLGENEAGDFRFFAQKLQETGFF